MRRKRRYIITSHAVERYQQRMADVDRATARSHLNLLAQTGKRRARPRHWTRTGEPIDPAARDLVIPADDTERKRHEAAFRKFCEIFPDALYVSERGRDYLGKPKAEQYFVG